MLILGEIGVLVLCLSASTISGVHGSVSPSWGTINDTMLKDVMADRSDDFLKTRTAELVEEFPVHGL